MISWYSITSAEYKAADASEKTDDKIFYLTDTQQIYRGTKNYTENVILYTTVPTSPVAGKLYVNKSTKECRIWDGSTWTIIIDPSSITTTLDKTVQKGMAFKCGGDYNERFYNSDIDNYFAGCRERFKVTAIYYDLGTEEENAKTFDNASVDKLFDGNYDTFLEIPTNKSAKITFDAFSMTYPYGYYMLRHYPTNKYASSVTCRIYSKNNTEFEWRDVKSVSIPNYSTTTGECIAFMNYGYYHSNKLEFVIEGNADKQVFISELEMWSFRYNTSQKAFVSRYGPQTLYFNLTAPKFIGNLQGTATKATADGDGNVISTTYDKHDATLLSNTADILDIINPGKYYGESGNTIHNKPENVDSFSLEVKRISKSPTNMFKYVLWDENNSTPYTMSKIYSLAATLKEESRNLLDTNFTVESSTINGVTFTNNNDGTFTVNGTNSNTSYTEFEFYTANLTKQGSYFLAWEQNRKSMSGLMYTKVLFYKNNTQVGNLVDYGATASLKFNIVPDFDQIKLKIGVYGGKTVENVLVEPYFALFSTLWEKGLSSNDNKELSDKVDSIINNDISISDPNTGGFFAGGAKKVINQQVGPDQFTDITMNGIGIGEGAKAWDKNSIAIGVNSDASDEDGISIGQNASCRWGISIGLNTKTYDGVAIGKNARTIEDSPSSGTAIGLNAWAGGGGFAGGENAWARGKLYEGMPESMLAAIDAIQLGTGENNDPKTFQVYNYRMMNDDGTIPDERMTSKVSVEEGKSLIDENVASALSYDSATSTIKSDATGGFNIAKLNNASIGDLSELVATNTTLLEVIKDLQNRISTLETRLADKSVLYVDNQS